jgi:hypothetical protein
MSDQGISDFRGLGAAVDGGTLYLEPDVAQRCGQRCADFVSQLKELQKGAQSLSTIDGFGDRLKSGVDLAAKFEKKAVGGDYSLDQALSDHIAVVQDMQQVFEKIAAMYAASEDRGTADINSAGAAL